MSSLEPAPGGRFGAATPGTRPSRPSLEALLAAQQAPRRRRITLRRILALLGVVAVGAGGYLAGHYTWASPSPKVSALVVTTTAIPRGAPLSTAGLRVITLQSGHGVPAGALSPAAAASLTGLVARSALPAGTFLQRSLLTQSGAIPGSGQALVGLALKPGELPAAGLVVGERVLVVLLPVSSAGTALNPVPLLTTTVWYLQGPDSSGNTDATVVVPAWRAALLASYSSRGEVALVATNAGPNAASAATAPNPAGAGRKPAGTAKSRKKAGSVP